MKVLQIGVLTLLAACAGDESLRAYGGEGVIWALESLDGTAFSAPATLGLPEPGRAVGQGPCNRWFAAQTAVYPWFALGPIGATRMACPDLAAEQQYFDALSAMTLSEIVGDTLVLSTEEGREMVFRAAPAGSADQ